MKAVWCRWDDCFYEIEIRAGVLPEHCPKCKRMGRWTTEHPLVTPAATETPYTDPTVIWELNDNDKRLLKSLRIAVNNDHEADGA